VRHPRPTVHADIAERRMFERLRQSGDPRLRAALVERYLPLARHVTKRFVGAGLPRDDLFQVACLALVKAVDRFDPDHGVAFSSYAVPTMVGEIKRHLRDETWALHVPRDLQERALRTRRTAAVLTRRLGRTPTVHELATALECEDVAVLDALRAGSAYRAASLDAPREPRAGRHASRARDGQFGYDEPLFTRVEQGADLWPLVGTLAAHERAVLRLRYECDLTQPEIARALGISQAHVSRILRRALEHLRSLQARDAA
jgi:RNA polymerase sigma-B factor